MYITYFEFHSHHFLPFLFTYIYTYHVEIPFLRLLEYTAAHKQRNMVKTANKFTYSASILISESHSSILKHV